MKVIWISFLCFILINYQGQYEQVGYCRGPIYNAFGNSITADAIIIWLNKRISNYFINIKNIVLRIWKVQ